MTVVGGWRSSLEIHFYLTNSIGWRAGAADRGAAARSRKITKQIPYGVADNPLEEREALAEDEFYETNPNLLGLVTLGARS